MNGYDIIALGIVGVVVIVLAIVGAGTALAVTKAKREKRP